MAETFTIGQDRLTPLVGGRERLDRLLALIEGAARSLRILFYIYAPDESGRRVLDALVAARAREVDVALVVDGFGSDADDDFFRPLTDAGGTVCRFLPRLGRRYLVRNHQKLALADESVAIVGGFNVEDAYFDDGPDGWRDLGLVVEGPAAARLAPYFDHLHAWARDPKAKVRALRHGMARFTEDEGALRWIFGGPSARLSPWVKAIRRDLALGRRLDMIAAYFVPNPANLRRIERLVRRNGGEARVMTAAKTDNNATIGAARHTYARLLRRGVRVAEYLPRKLHTKLYVVDDASHIGSANFDVRSLYLNLEMMLRVEDAAFAAAMRAYAEAEWAEAHEVTRDEHRRAGPLLRLRWTLAYYIVAVLDYTVTRRLNFGFE